MDFESPDVEKDFPGLYASESGRKSNESDFSDTGDHDKPSKKDLLGRRKEKKEKKDRGYAALEGESSPEEDTDTNPSKSKKNKSFKFPTKIKEKREKSRDKEKVLEEAAKKELTEKEKKKEKEKEKKEKEKREKLKEKDKEKEEKAKFKLESKEKLKDDKKDKSKEKEKEKVKEKDKDKVKEKEKDKVKEKEKDKVKEKEKVKDKEKVKEKDKDKKDKDKKEKKLIKMPSTVTSGVPFEEIFTLGVALPIFGVPLEQSVDRMRCHDDTMLPLVVRDSIDYLQANGLKSNQIYRAEADKIKLQQLRKLYADRGATFPYHWDVPVACAMLKTFISELPESILTQELQGQFEQALAMSSPTRETSMMSLLNKLPACNKDMLAWLMIHFDNTVQLHQVNHANIQTIFTYIGPVLDMSQNLFTYLVTNVEKLFPGIKLTKYVPPLQSLPLDFPDSANEIAEELRKQESFLNQIHAEMHAGFTTPARDQQLWESQRIVTQLKRKLRAIQKSAEPTSMPPQTSIDEPKPAEEEPKPETTTVTVEINPEPESLTTQETFEAEICESPKPIEAPFPTEFEDNFDITNTEVSNTTNETEVIKPKLSENEIQRLRLELENAEYLQLKSILQAKINSEQFEIVKLRSQVALRNKLENNTGNAKEKDSLQNEDELIQKLLKENSVLEQKRVSLINQIFQERVACIQLKIDLAMKELL